MWISQKRYTKMIAMAIEAKSVEELQIMLTEDFINSVSPNRQELYKKRIAYIVEELSRKPVKNS